MIDKIRLAQRVLEEAVSELSTSIGDLPDNPNIVRRASNPSVFTASSKDLGSVWSPEYYDFRIQYEAIREGISKHPLDVLEWWEDVRDSGKIKTREGTALVLHPDVIKHVDALIHR